MITVNIQQNVLCRVSEDAKSSQEALQSPQRSEPSSSGSSLLQQSPYANNTVEWSLPPFSNGRQLGIIPEEPRLGLRRNGHKREVSFGESVNSTDEEPTPFSTQVCSALLKLYVWRVRKSIEKSSWVTQFSRD